MAVLHSSLLYPLRCYPRTASPYSLVGGLRGGGQHRPLPVLLLLPVVEPLLQVDVRHLQHKQQQQKQGDAQSWISSCSQHSTGMSVKTTCNGACGEGRRGAGYWQVAVRGEAGPGVHGVCPQGSFAIWITNNATRSRAARWTRQVGMHGGLHKLWLAGGGTGGKPLHRVVRSKA